MSKCECKLCDYCKGTGSMWVWFDGTRSSTKGDDLSELETCEMCRGSGIEVECDECEEINMNIEYEEGDSK